MKSIFEQLKLPGSNTYKVTFKRKVSKDLEVTYQDELEFDFDSLKTS